jgi:hypothetical protein
MTKQEFFTITARINLLYFFVWRINITVLFYLSVDFRGVNEFRDSPYSASYSTNNTWNSPPQEA